MDAFVTIHKQKKNTGFSLLHEKEVSDLKKHLDEGKNVFLCGASGFGKSFILNQVLDETNSLEINDDTLQRKDLFLSTIRNSNKHAIIEDYETDVHVLKHIIESVAEGKSITKKQLVVTSKNVFFMDNFVTMIIPKREPETIIKLKPKHPNALVSAKMCNGNLHNFFHYIDYPHEKDIFKSSKDYVTDILCIANEKVNITNSIHEHGHVWSIISENFPYALDDNMDKVSHSLSMADMYDEYMYKGDWEMMPYFVLYAIKIPKSYFTKQLEPDKVKPGKFWTKFGNQKMRQQKVRSIQVNSNTKMLHHEFMLLREYAKKGDVSKFKDYSLTPQDFDVMNHLGIQNKLKQKEVTRIKKMIKEEIA